MKKITDFVFGPDQFGYGTKEKSVLGVAFIAATGSLIGLLTIIF